MKTILAESTLARIPPLALLDRRRSRGQLPQMRSLGRHELADVLRRRLAAMLADLSRGGLDIGIGPELLLQVSYGSAEQYCGPVHLALSSLTHTPFCSIGPFGGYNTADLLKVAVSRGE